MTTDYPSNCQYAVASGDPWHAYLGGNGIFDTFDVTITKGNASMVYSICPRLFITPDFSASLEMEASKSADTPFNILITDFKDENGKITYTNESMRVSVANRMLLEKIGNDGNCVSSAYYNHLGVPGGSGSLNKDSKIRNNPTRTAGEAEVRNYAGHVNEEVLAEIADRATSIPTHESICKAILEADKPTNIKRIVDRTKIPYGQSRPLQLVEHILYCGGSEFIYENPK